MGPRPYRVALALCIATVLLGIVAVAGPTLASSTAPTDTEPAFATDGNPAALAAGDGTNLTAVDTVFVAAAATEDGGVVVGGSTGLRRGNGTLTRVTPDGEISWTRTYPVGNASGMIDVETGPDGHIYFLQYTLARGGTHSSAVWLGRATEAGTVEWRRRIDTDVSLGGTDTLAVSGSGPAVAGRTPETRNVTLTQFNFDGDIAWNRTYGAEAAPGTLRATDDGYLLAGTASFDRPWVLRTDRDGTERINETYAGTEIRRPVGVVPVDDGFVIAGTHSVRGASAPLAAKIGDDGVVRWSRVYPATSDVRLRSVFPDGDGVALLGTGGFAGLSDPAGHLVGVGPEGGERYAGRIEGFLPTDAVIGPDRRVVAVGTDGFSGQNVTGHLRTATLPGAPTDREFAADVELSSNATHYRGQNVGFDTPVVAGETVDVVRVPDERDDFEAHAVRRLTPDERGRVVFESATLPRGEYYVEAGGEALVFENGTAATGGDDAEARFRIVDHDLRSVPDRERDRGREPFLDRAAGETDTTIPVRSSPGRADYILHVGVDRFRGDSADAGTLRQLFGTDPGFEGVERIRGEPVARIAAGGDETEIAVTAGDVAPGLYRVTLRSADTAEAGATLETRLAVGPEQPRPLSLSLENGSLSVPVGGEASTNVSVSGATDGIGALSMSAVRTGEPAIGLSADVSIDASSGRGSAGWSDREATASARAIGGETANGTVTVGSLSVETDRRAISPNASASNTVSVGLDWAVDPNGRPYTIPDGTTIPVEVTDLGNATGDRRGSHGSASGSRSSGSDVRDR